MEMQMSIYHPSLELGLYTRDSAVYLLTIYSVPAVPATLHQLYLLIA